MKKLFLVLALFIAGFVSAQSLEDIELCLQTGHTYAEIDSLFINHSLKKFNPTSVDYVRSLVKNENRRNCYFSSLTIHSKNGDIQFNYCFKTQSAKQKCINTVIIADSKYLNLFNDDYILKTFGTKIIVEKK